jgi:hypothetical protein
MLETDMVWDEKKKVYHYPCPCGDRFEITKVSEQDAKNLHSIFEIIFCSRNNYPKETR